MESVENFAAVKEKIIKIDEVMQMCLQYKQKFIKIQQQSKLKVKNLSNDIKRLTIEKDRINFSLDTLKKKHDELTETHNRLKVDHGSLEEKYSEQLLKNQRHVLEMEEKIKEHINKGIEQKQKNFKGKLSTLNKSENENKKEISRLTNLQNETLKEYELFKKSAAETEKILRHKCQELENDLLLAKNKLENYSCGSCHILTNEIGCLKETISHLKLENEFLQDSNKNKFLNLRDQTTQTDIQTEINAIKTESRNQFCNSQTQTIDVQDKQTENESNICDQCIMNQMLIPAMLTPLHETGYLETEYNHTLDMDMEIEEHINDYTELVNAEHNISFGNNITEEKTEKCVSDENNLPDLDYLNDENNLESIMQCCENNSVSDIDVNKQEFNDCKMSTETDPSLDNIETIEGIDDNLNTTMTDSHDNLLSPKKNNTQSDKKDTDISDDREKKELLRRRDLKRKKRRLITNFRNYNEYRISNLFLKNNYNTKSSRRNSKNDILDAVLTLKKANIDFTISNRNARRIPRGSVNHYKLERKNSLRKYMEIHSEENNITKGLLKHQMSHKKQDQLDQLTKDFQDVCDSKMFNSKDLLEENEKLQKIINLAQEIVKQKDAIINNKQQPTELIADIKIEDELDEKDEIVQIETSPKNIKTITQNSASLKSEKDKKHELNSASQLGETSLPLEISQNDVETSVESKCSYSNSPTKAINNISTDSVSNFDLQNHSTPQKKVERNHNIPLSTENLSPVSNKSDSDQSLLDKIFNDSQLIIPKLLSPISESSSKCKTNTTINNVSIDSQIVLPHMECVNLTALSNCSYVQRIVHELDSEFKAVKETENCDSIAEIVVNDSDKENIIEETENVISNDMDEQIFGPRNINLTNGIETESLTSDTKSEIENSFEPNNTEIFNTILNQSAILSNSAIKSLESNLNDSKCSDNSFLKKILSWKNTSLDDKLACTQIKKERGKQKHGERDLNVKKVNIVQNVVIKPANEKKCEEKETNLDNSKSKELDISNISTQNSAEQLNSVDELHVIKRKRGRPKKNNVENFASVISHKVEGKDGPEQLISVNEAQVMKRKRGRPQNANDDVHKRKEAKLKRDSVLGENKCDIELNKLDNNVSETNLMVNSSTNLSINNESSHKIKQTMDLDSKVKINRMPILEAKERGTNKCNKLNNTSDMSDVVSEILTLMDRPVGHASPDIQSPVNTLMNDSKENSFDFDHPISPEPPCESFDTPRIIPLERPSRIPPAQVKELFEKLIMFPNEKEILDEVVVQLVGQDSEYLAKLILVMILRDLTEKPDNSQDQCAPPLTLWQKIAVGLIIRLDKTNGGNIQDIFLSDVQAYIFSKRADLRQTIDLTRTFTTLCRARKDINKMRVFCCDAFYFMDNLAVPIFFTVLTCWSEVIPNYKDSKDYALARVLAQLSITKAFNIKGYSLMSLKRLLTHFYEYPKELDNNEFFNDIFNAYSKYPSKNNDQAIILFCKHQPDKWILSQIDGKFKPLVHKTNSINFKATIIVLLGKIFKNFKDVTLLNETTMWLNSLKNDLNSEVIARAVKYSLMRISR